MLRLLVLLACQGAATAWIASDGRLAVGSAASAVRSMSSIAMAASASAEGSTASGATATKDPLLVRAARGEKVERSPVWMMRQAGRHMAVYRALVDKYPTFRERSEIPEVSYEVSLQPWRAYGVDGVILFSDILTPLPAMGVDFSISEAGGITIDPIRTREAFKRMSEHGAFDPAKDVPFVGEVLQKLRTEVAESGAA